MTCAQRLSASGRKALAAHLIHRDRLQVLNAFRHQGGKHNESLPLGGQVDLVLNAFRHQGGKHPLLGRLHYRFRSRAQRLSASGRKALRGRRFGGLRKGVLNAFRHQGGKHTRASTISNAPSSAQRLSASGRKAPPALHPFNSMDDTNASFKHPLEPHHRAVRECGTRPLNLHKPASLCAFTTSSSIDQIVKELQTDG